MARRSAASVGEMLACLLIKLISLLKALRGHDSTGSQVATRPAASRRKQHRRQEALYRRPAARPTDCWGRRPADCPPPRPLTARGACRRTALMRSTDRNRVRRSFCECCREVPVHAPCADNDNPFHASPPLFCCPEVVLILA